MNYALLFRLVATAAVLTLGTAILYQVMFPEPDPLLQISQQSEN
jgi:hypothetical protein